MATVHLGRLLGPAGFSKIVAIKRLHPKFATDPEFLSMLIDEARLASVISHPNVVSSLDVVVENDELLLVMEYVQGETLAQLIRLARKRHASPPLGIIQRILCDTLDGLHAAHTASVGGHPLNIVHRDVSPQNIMVGSNGVARVLDFGIAKAESQSQSTRPGLVKGKCSYLSPEQIRGRPLDARTDVFSAGVVLWESLTGQRLFSLPGAAAEPSAAKTVKRVLSAPIPPPSSKNSSVSAALDRVVLKALERDRARRYQSAAEFADALRAVSGEATRAEVSAWVSSTAAEVLAQRRHALQELEVMDVADAHVRPNSKPPSAWDDATIVELPKAEGHLRAGSRSASLTSGGTTRSLNPDVQAPQRRRYVAGVGLALLVSSLTVIGVASSRRHVPAVAASSARPAPFMPEHQLPAAPTAALMNTPAEHPLALASANAGLPATVSVPVVQLDQLPAAPRVAPLRPVVSGVHPVSVKTTRSERTAAASVNCDLPYRIDASGVRRVRFECL
jgi:serine/threonine-protein kinase